MRFFLAATGVAVTGLGSGLVGALLVTHGIVQQPSVRAPAPSAGPESAVVTAAQTVVSAAPACVGLQTSLNDQRPSAGPKLTSPLPPPPTEEEGQNVVEAARVERVTAHNQEPVDRAWARAMTASLTAALDARKHSATYRDLDCRSVSCMATLEWPDKVTAQKEIGQLAMVGGDPSGPPCFHHVDINQSQSSDGPATATLLIDCTNRFDAIANK